MWQRNSRIVTMARRVRLSRVVLAVGLVLLLVVTSVVILAPHRAQAQQEQQVYFSMTETQITTNLANQTDPAISGNYIVYTDNRNGNKDIYLYNLATRTETNLTPGASSDQYLDDVSGSKVVYTDLPSTTTGSDVYLFDVATSETIPLATGSYDYGPAIDGNYVTWVDVSGNTQSIVLADVSNYDAITSIILTAEETMATKPRVQGNTVVWTEHVGDYYQIFAYNITTGETKQLTDGACEHQDPDVSGRYVVWADHCNGNWDVSLYDLDTGITKQLSTSTSDQQYPRISGERVVWQDTRTGVSQVWLYDIPTGDVFQVSPSTHAQILNNIDGNHIVWADPRYGADNYDIFMATFSVGEDTTAPTTTATIKPAPNSDGWNHTDVTVALRAIDTGGSGVKATYYTLDGGATQTYPIGGISVTSEGEHPITYWSVDYAGNVEATQEVTIRIDKTAPTISLTSPQDGATYFYQQQVAAAYSATDAVSGVASVSGTTPNGLPIETSSLGTHTFTVNAADHAGNTASTSVTYTVKLPASTVTLQPPLSGSASTVVKSGRSLPIKFQLIGPSGPIADAVVRVYLARVDANGAEGTLIPAHSTVAANGDNICRYDQTAQQYIFNLSTTGLLAGTYHLKLYVAGDPTTGVLLAQATLVVLL